MKDGIAPTPVYGGLNLVALAVGVNNRLTRHGLSCLQPRCNFSVKHKVKAHIGFIKHAPSFLARTKLDTTLTHAVFVGIATGKVQPKGWKGIRQIEGHFRSSFTAQNAICPCECSPKRSISGSTVARKG